jgi:hypothetical protein
VEAIEKHLLIDLKPLLVYMDKCGIKSLGADAEYELKAMLKCLFVCFALLLAAMLKSVGQGGQANSFDEMRRKITIPMDATLEKRVNTELLAIQRTQQKYALVCSQLELARNWQQLTHQWLFDRNHSL